MNIRESATTASRVAATARAGDSFAVLSSQRGDIWCWLQIDKGWLAKTSRVSSTQSTGAAPQANLPQQPDINNCCFVNRQCESDQQWTDGYFAFQRNECPVSAPVQTQSSSAYAGMTIIGPQAVVDRVQQALTMLYERTPHWWDYVTGAFNTIKVISRAEFDSDYHSCEKGHPSHCYLAERIPRILAEDALRSCAILGGCGDAIFVELLSSFVTAACELYNLDAGVVAEDWEAYRACIGTRIEAQREIDIHNHYQGDFHGQYNRISADPATWYWTTK